MIGLELSGLTFDKPIHIELDVPLAPDGSGGGGIVWWSTLDGSEFSVAGFAQDGKAVAENTHFSEVAVGDGTGPADDPAQTWTGCESEEGEPTCRRCDDPPAAGGPAASATASRAGTPASSRRARGLHELGDAAG